ncbi:MAG TPA: alpha/beta hydrolase [Gemmatimonadaceae bacterium]|nr:alpha/beta hydrolase [Gemmatimonadaceae bacterium]
MFLSALAAIAMLFAIFATLALISQRPALFPVPNTPRSARPRDATQLWLSAGSARVEAWFLPATGASGRAPLLIFAHGNAELIDDWPAEFAQPRAWGVSVLLVEYPGYGRSEGRPSETSITAAITAAYDWAVRQPTVDRERIIAYGRSIGSGAACALAKNRPVAAIVLESSFTSVRRLARRFGVPGFLVRDPFDNLTVVRAFRGPILLVHGELDDIIPSFHSRLLHTAAPHATLEMMNCGHNDCPRPWPALKRFLTTHRFVAADSAM